MTHRTVYIFAQDSEYRETVAQICADFETRRMLPLLGAGISRESPANLPLANALCRPLRKALWRSAKPARRKDWSTEHVKTALRHLKLARLERILDALQETHGRTAVEYLTVLNGTVWNDNHATLAALSSKSFLPFCFTLNFDLLIEKAIVAQGGACRTLCPLIGQEFHSGSPGDIKTSIIKPHGSFVPELAGPDPLEFLSATLSQVGNYPAKANERLFAAAVTACPALFVAGYSDDDWDIFPMMQKAEQNFARIYWIEYASPAKVAAYELPLPPKPPNNDSLGNRIIPWLDQLRVPSTLLVGNPRDLFRDVALGLKLDLPQNEPLTNPSPEPSARVFMPGIPGNEERAVRTAVSLAILLQDTGDFNRKLLHWLTTHPYIKRTPMLSARVERILTHTEHTDGNLSLALSHMRKSVSLKTQVLSQELAYDLLWLGYENLCMVKRPNLFRPLQFICLPFYFLRGVWLLSKAVRLADPANVNKVNALAQFYRGDLVHSWATLLLLLGHRVTALARPLYRQVCRIYEKARSCDQQLMESEYYWLRHIEASILGGRVSRDELEMIGRRIKGLEESYRILQNSVQMGNIYAYAALIRFVYADTDEDRQAAVEQLKRVAREWRNGRKTMAAGRRRVIFFRRYIGDVSFWQAIRLLLDPAHADNWGAEAETCPTE